MAARSPAETRTRALGFTAAFQCPVGRSPAVPSGCADAGSGVRCSAGIRRSSTYTPRSPTKAITKITQPESEWKKPVAYSIPTYWPISPVATTRPALAMTVMGTAAAARSAVAQPRPNMRAPHATASASIDTRDRIPLHASVTPRVIWLKWITFPSSMTGTPSKSRVHAALVAASCCRGKAIA